MVHCHSLERNGRTEASLSSWEIWEWSNNFWTRMSSIASLYRSRKWAKTSRLSTRISAIHSTLGATVWKPPGVAKPFWNSSRTLKILDTQMKKLGSWMNKAKSGKARARISKSEMSSPFSRPSMTREIYLGRSILISTSSYWLPWKLTTSMKQRSKKLKMVFWKLYSRTHNLNEPFGGNTWLSKTTLSQVKKWRQLKKT